MPLIDADRLEQDPTGTIKRVLEFAKLPPVLRLDGSLDAHKKRRHDHHQTMLQESRTRLLDFYRESDSQLKEMFPDIEFQWMNKQK